MKKNHIEEIKTDLKKFEIIDFKIQWTTSKGLETYGQNICSFYYYLNFQGYKKITSCKGGNYDMTAINLATILNNVFYAEIQNLKENFSNAIIDSNNIKFVVGSCGTNAMKMIFKELNYEIIINDKMITLKKLLSN